jgi:hypothetical protein
MSLGRRISLMMNERVNREILIFLFASLAIFSGFFVIYESGISLSYLVSLNSDIPMKMFSIQDSQSISGFIQSNFNSLFVAIFGLVLICLTLSILSISHSGRYKYLLAAPIFLSGILFNFSILFLFFGAGLFIACLFVIPLGETYFQELKKWKRFRVGSNAVGKALFVVFLFVFVGTYIALSLDARYGENFSKGMENGISDIVLNEVENMQSNQNIGTGEQQIKKSMLQVRIDYPNLTEQQYAEMEKNLRASLSSNLQKAGPSKEEVGALVAASLKSSPLFSSVLVWFPLFFSFTIWISLEFLRSFFLSLISGVFTFILLHIPFFNQDLDFEGKETAVRAIEYKLENEAP